MAYNTKISLNNDKVCQNSGELLTLSGNTVIAASGSLNYEEQPTWTGDTQVATKKYVDDAVVTSTGSTVYNLASPSTVEVGGMDAGTVLTSKTSNEILEEILTPYQTPTFSSFGSELDSPVEVGTVISDSKQFTWGFNEVGNVAASTMCIIDVTATSNLATNISISSPQSTTINTVTFTSCGQLQQYKGCAEDSCGNAIGSSNHVITGLYPYFWGKCTSPGAAGAGRPSLTAGDITGGTKVLSGSAASFSITFNSGDDDYLWFAVPASVANKGCWFVNNNNYGDIGGGVSAGCNLFPDPDIVNNVQNACWSGVAYEVYVSNKQTAQTAAMTIS